jgi:hypothetical protein
MLALFAVESAKQLGTVSLVGVLKVITLGFDALSERLLPLPLDVFMAARSVAEDLARGGRFAKRPRPFCVVDGVFKFFGAGGIIEGFFMTFFGHGGGKAAFLLGALRGVLS